jgi:RNA polymerase sigma-70 factor (ECF subfamily)
MKKGMTVSIPLTTDFMYHNSIVEQYDEINLTTIKEASDSELVKWAQANQMEAFDELIKRYRNDVFGLAFHYIRNREEAWDLAQEVFIKAYKAIGRFRGDSAFKTWLLRITANRCKDFFKKRKLNTVAMENTVVEQTVSGGVTPEDLATSSELGNAIEKALNTLSEKHRSAFVLREFEGMSYDDMAAVMGCSTGTVMSRLHHARKKLQQTLSSMGIMEGN